MRKVILSLLFICQTSWGNVTYLQEGKPAPYSGYLFTLEIEKEAREAVILVPKLRMLVSQQNDMMNVLEKRIDIKEAQIENYKMQLDRKENFWSRGIYFVAGVIVTGGFLYGIKKLQ